MHSTLQQRFAEIFDQVEKGREPLFLLTPNARNGSIEAKPARYQASDFDH
jgi:hypothetical protein